MITSSIDLLVHRSTGVEKEKKQFNQSIASVKDAYFEKPISDGQSKVNQLSSLFK